MDIQSKWQEMLKAKLRSVKTLKQLQELDLNIKEIISTLKEIYSHNLDTLCESDLLRYGGKLLGHYASLGVSSSIKRAERDASTQTYEEILAEMTTFNKGEEMGITEARAMAKEQMSEFSTEIITSEQIKNSYEAIVDATGRTISFLQSALRVKNEERSSVGKFGDES